MKTINLKKIGLTIYNEKLENGLDVYLIPNKNLNDMYAVFLTRYGSINSEFIPIGEQKMIKVPSGIAHFLEHKLFEQKDGIHPFKFLSKSGANVNAYTNYFNTAYHFSGGNNNIENLKYLLDFVQDPYFTDANVKKEKGIIEQELLMYEDMPESKIVDKTFENLFHTNPVRIPIGGTVESIKKITKEELYTCYNTYYHPSNMALIVSGNFNENEVLEVVKENQDKKEFKEAKEIVNKKYEEEDTVCKKKEIIKMNVSIPMVMLTYKFKIPSFKMAIRDILIYTEIYFKSRIGATSLTFEELKSEDVLKEIIDIGYLKTDKHMAFMCFVNTLKEKEFTNKVNESLETKQVSEEEFNRKLKMLKSLYLRLSDNIYGINDKVLTSLIEDLEVTNFEEDFERLNYKDFMKVVNELDFTNNTEVIINPLKDI